MVDYGVLKTILQDTSYFNVDWVIGLVLVLLTVAIITRDTEKWKTLQFPVMIGWAVAGIRQFELIYVAGAILFVVECLSIETIGRIARKLTKTGRALPYVTETVERKERRRERARRLRESLKELKTFPEKKRKTSLRTRAKRRKKQITKRISTFMEE